MQKAAAARQAVKLRDDQRDAVHAAEAKRLLQLQSGVVTAALGLDDLRKNFVGCVTEGDVGPPCDFVDRFPERGPRAP